MRTSFASSVLNSRQNLKYSLWYLITILKDKYGDIVLQSIGLQNNKYQHALLQTRTDLTLQNSQLVRLQKLIILNKQMRGTVHFHSVGHASIQVSGVRLHLFLYSALDGNQ
jgi:hypothetical protein